MRRSLLPALVLVLLGAPAGTQASVFVSEIAWMGTDESGTCEWIELYNDGSETVDLSTWSLTIDNPGSSKTVLFNEAGSVRYQGIASKGFYLLARKSTSCNPPIADSLVDWLGSFGSGISNDGAKITLFNGVVEEDVVDALSGWKTSGVGGTNTAPKKTPQYTGSGWFEAAPTPRNTNSAPASPELPEEGEVLGATTPEVTVGGTVPMLAVEHPVAKLLISAIPSRIVFAGAQTPYNAVVYDSTGKLRREADVRWSFGDGGSEKGHAVRYTYAEPGEYTAVARATGSKGGSAVSLIPIVVVTTQVTVSSVDERGITLTNPSERLADLSLWKLKGDKKTFTLPEDTVIAAGKTTLLPWSVTRLASTSEISLLYPDGSPVYSGDK